MNYCCKLYLDIKALDGKLSSTVITTLIISSFNLMLWVFAKLTGSAEFKRFVRIVGVFLAIISLLWALLQNSRNKHTTIESMTNGNFM